MVMGSRTIMGMAYSIRADWMHKIEKLSDKRAVPSQPRPLRRAPSGPSGVSLKSVRYFVHGCMHYSEE